MNTFLGHFRAMPRSISEERSEKGLIFGAADGIFGMDG
jgi:hypothetical protein